MLPFLTGAAFGIRLLTCKQALVERGERSGWMRESYLQNPASGRHTLPLSRQPPKLTVINRETSGIHPAIDGQIRPGNVRGVRAGDERYHCGDFFNAPVATERCGSLLWHRPIA
jgi:hypothetical protein